LTLTASTAWYGSILTSWSWASGTNPRLPTSFTDVFPPDFNRLDWRKSRLSLVQNALFAVLPACHSGYDHRKNTHVSGAAFFNPHLPAIGKLTLPASEPEVIRKTFLTSGQ
jgi:hypothetical protein